MTTIGKGRAVRSQTKEVVYNVKSFFDSERENLGPVISLTKVTCRVAAATGLGLSRVRSICREAEQAKENGCKFPSDTPGKKRIRLSPVTNLDSFALEAIRQKIHWFYLNGMIPSIGKLLKTINEDDQAKEQDAPDVFKGCAESLRRVVTKQLGFKYQKTNGRKHLLERNDVVAWRHSYLRTVQELDLDKVIFLDETWVNENHSVSFCWQSEECSGSAVPVGKGRRLILLHAGTSKGFVPNCMLLFPSKSGKADYHHDMNAVVFTEWFVKQLLPNITPNSTIIMDNESYHSVQRDKAPCLKSLKKDMQDWLQQNNISFCPTMIKAELYELVKQHKPRNIRYEIDEIAAAPPHCHKVIRLPPYHCQFNPIELIWAQVKKQVAVENKTFKLNDVKILTEKALADVKPENWKNAVRHVKSIMEKYLENDIHIETTLEPFIITLNGESDSDTDTGSEMSDESQDTFERAFTPLQ